MRKRGIVSEISGSMSGGGRARLVVAAAGVMIVAACASAPGPGDAGYAYNVDGRYSGRLMVEAAPFDASFDLRTSPGGRVRGTFGVRAPLEIEGSIEGMVLDDLLRVTLTYEATGGRDCESRIEGILTISPGGQVVDGPVTITDCGDALPGRMSFRRSPS
jgi:hypothetical protein